MTVVKGFLTGNFFVVFAKMMKWLLFVQLKYIKALSSEDLNDPNDADPYFLRYNNILLALWDFMMSS